MNVLAAFKGITTPTNELYEQITRAGWTPGKLKWDKSLGAFVAEATGPFGDTVSKTGPNDKTALGNLLIAIHRHNHIRTAAQWKIGMWKTMFTDQLQPIAEAYAKAPVYDPKAAGAFKALADDSVHRAAIIGQQIQVEVVDDPEPYANAQEMAKDIHEKQHFYVSRANSEHPVWSVDQNVAFRTVHDVLGHAVSGGDFGWQGENRACAAHFPLLSPIAQQALFTECIAQTAYAAFYRSFGPQKVALFPEFTDGPTKAENAPGHTGIHPSQSVVPTSMPAVDASPPGDQIGLPQGTIAPHMDVGGFVPLMSPSFSKASGYYTDKLGPEADESFPHDFSKPPNHVYRVMSEEHFQKSLQDGYHQSDERGNYIGQAQEWPEEWEGETPDSEGTVAGRWAYPGYGINSQDGLYRIVKIRAHPDDQWEPHPDDDEGGYWRTFKPIPTDRFESWTDPMSPHTWAPVHRIGSVNQIDPNAGWSSGINPMQLATDGVGNAYLDHGDPLESHKVMDNASLIDTKWHQFTNGAGEPDMERMKQAIVNAFRVVLLSPRKDLRWNAIHYQDIADVSHHVDDPKVYWDHLENKRQRWNERQGIDPQAHMVYFKFLKKFEAIVYTKHPELGREGAKKKADDLFFKWWTEEQEKIAAEDDDKPEHKQRDAGEIERRANEALARRLKAYTNPKSDEDTDVPDLAPMFETEAEEPLKDRLLREHQERAAAENQYNLLTGEEALKYGAFMGTHLKAISQVSRHADEILKAALEDVHEHDATGHHFRAATLALNISGVGPKVCSFAWLLLQPMTSQLATIDTHMMDVLGHNYDKEMNNRDYFKFERELAAGRDASGYQHIPLGAFQWGMWDHKRTGPGSHQDHSAMRVLDPKPHQDIDWVGKAQNLKGEEWAKQAPDWWQNTQPARDLVAREWDENVAENTAQNKVPFQVVARISDMQRNAARNGEGSVDEFHVGIGLPEEVVVKIAEWTASLDWPEDSELEKPENYHITILWDEHGYADHGHHEWIRKRSVSGLPLEATSLTTFPTQDKDKGDAVVLRFEGKELKELANELMDEAEERGLKIKRFDGGFKPHVTIGWAKSKPKGKKLDLAFRTEGLYVSVPRPLRKQAIKDRKGFKYWWNKEKPHSKSDAKKMAEYAVGGGTSKKEALKFISDHGSDVQGSLTEFKKAFEKKFDRINLYSHVRISRTKMQDAIERTGLSTPEIWDKLGDDHLGMPEPEIEVVGEPESVPKPLPAPKASPPPAPPKST